MDATAQRASAPRPFGTIIRIGTLFRPAVPAGTMSKGPTPSAIR